MILPFLFNNRAQPKKKSAIPFLSSSSEVWREKEGDRERRGAMVAREFKLRHDGDEFSIDYDTDHGLEVPVDVFSVDNFDPLKTCSIFVIRFVSFSVYYRFSSSRSSL